MSTSGTILSRKVNGLCRKMQSKITRTIKYARGLGLFSYKHGEFTIRNPAYIEDEKEENEEDEVTYDENKTEYDPEQDKKLDKELDKYLNEDVTESTADETDDQTSVDKYRRKGRRLLLK